MRTRTRSYATLAGLAALALAVTACGSSGTTGGSTGGAVSLNSGLQALNPGTGSPQKGGTLTMVGAGDVDYMDPNISYYSVGYQGLREWVRSLYAYPAIPGHTTAVAPDLATAMPTVSDGGSTYAVTIRSDAKFDTSPPTPVTGADAVLGLKRSCNPAQPFGGLPDFQSLIVGFEQFCAGFAKVSPTSATAMKNYINTHQISGVSSSGQTVTYHLTHPASYFTQMLNLPPFNPAPPQILQYVPNTTAEAQHTIADGPYKIASYTPLRKIVFVRNPAWVASSDPIRKAYVNEIVVNETGNADSNQQQLQTNSAAAGMEWDTPPPQGSILGLIQGMLHPAPGSPNAHNFALGPTYSSNPYVIYNQDSPNNGGALSKPAVRQALSYGTNRAHLIQDLSGPKVSPPLTHVLPDGINGAQYLPKGFDPYPYNPAKAKQMLAAAGFKNGFTLKFLYRPVSTSSVKIFQTLQADWGKIGVKLTGVGVPNADFYTKYLEVPAVAKRGVWDVSLAGWGPDWYGDAAASFFLPLFSGPSSFPPNGSNFGFYSNPSVTTKINQAAAQASATTAGQMWAQIDQQVMKDDPIFPITDGLWPIYHANYVHNAVYVADFQNFDPTNVWLSKPSG